MPFKLLLVPILLLMSVLFANAGARPHVTMPEYLLSIPGATAVESDDGSLKIIADPGTTVTTLADCTVSTSNGSMVVLHYPALRCSVRMLGSFSESFVNEGQTLPAGTGVVRYLEFPIPAFRQSIRFFFSGDGSSLWPYVKTADG